MCSSISSYSFFSVVDFHWVSSFEFIAAYSPVAPPPPKGSGGVPPPCQVLSITVEVGGHTHTYTSPVFAKLQLVATMYIIVLMCFIFLELYVFICMHLLYCMGVVNQYYC